MYFTRVRRQLAAAAATFMSSERLIDIRQIDKAKLCYKRKNLRQTFCNFRQRRVGHSKPAHKPQGKRLKRDAARLSRGIELTGINDKLPNPS